MQNINSLLVRYLITLLSLDNEGKNKLKIIY